MSHIILMVALSLALTKGNADSIGSECPCLYRETDPLFPGEEGSRLDCEYVLHGLAEIPTICFIQHPNVTQVFLDYNELETLSWDSFLGLTNLRTLSLKHNKLATVEEGALTGLNLLELLDMSSNYLEAPPQDIWDLVQLRHLYLSDNKFSDGHKFNLSNLANLEVLDLHLNQLTELPYNSFQNQINLRKAHLHWNMLTRLPTVMHNFQLRELLVNGNALLEFPKYMFGSLAYPVTYHFVDNPANDVWATMLLSLPERSHIKMGFDVWVWAENEAQADELLGRNWLIHDGLNMPLNLTDLVKVCGQDNLNLKSRLAPC